MLCRIISSDVIIYVMHKPCDCQFFSSIFLLSEFVERAKYFLEEVKLCNESYFKSAGLGDDYRYEGQFIAGYLSLTGNEDRFVHICYLFIVDNKRDSDKLVNVKKEYLSYLKDNL